MNMASMCILLIFSVISISIGNAETGAFMSLKCKAENLGQYGQQSLLECVILAKDDTEIRTVTWKKDDEGDDTLLVFNKGNLKVKPGYAFAQPSWTVKDMNVSLLIDNTIVKHEGDYKCMVMTDRGNNEQTTSLKVTAKYSKPTIVSNPEAKILNTGDTLTCKSDGGYPKGELRWIDGRNAELTNEAQMEVKETDGGLFQLSSKLVLEKGSSASNYTCSVFNASGDKEGEKLFEVKDAPRAEEQEHRKTLDTATKIVAPVLVVGSLIVGLLIVGLLMIYKRRSRNTRRQSTTPLMGGHIKVDASALQEGDENDPDNLA